MAQGLDNVIFHGRKGLEEMPAYYRQADAMLVTLMKDDLPIVIAPGYQHRGIGGRVLRGLIAHARLLGWDHLAVEEIYQDNIGSQRLFLGAGFQKVKDTAQGASYRLEL